jgi:hypothetical protein
MITLGREIAGIVRGVKAPAQRNALLGPRIEPAQVGPFSVPTVHLAHPGIVMRKGDDERNPWPKLHATEHVPKLREALRSLDAPVTADPQPPPPRPHKPA